MLCEFAFANNMIIIMSTQFQHKQLYKPTWISPHETIINQTDRVFVNANKKEVSQN